MAFDFSSTIPSVHVRTCSTHYRAFSTELTTYVEWYKDDEQPTLIDAEFHAHDDFRLVLDDFCARFGD